jgi:4-amino-4-deoxy-L-arabinose transferase-like glycosyltransferase
LLEGPHVVPRGKVDNLVIVLAVATAARLLYFFSYLGSACNGFLGADHIYYREWALRICDGHWLGEGAFEQGPLYAYLLAVQFLAGLPEPVILFLQALSGVAVCLLVYLCGRRLFDERTATAAGVVTAVYGPLLLHECMLMKSFLSPLFVTLTLYFGLRYAGSLRTGWLWLAGAAVGLACLLRESYVLLMLPLAAWVWWTAAARQVSWPGRFGHVLALTAAFVLTLAPSAVRNYTVAHEFVAVTTGGGEVMYIAHGPEGDGYWNCRAVPFAKMNPRQEHQAYREEAERRAGRKLTAVESSRFWYGEALREIKARPGRFLALTGRRAVILLNNFEVPDSEDYQVWREFIPLLYLLPTFGWIVAFGLLGLCVCAADWPRYGLAVGLVAMIVLSVLLTYNFARFRLGMMPLWILLATAGFFRWLSWWRGETRRPVLAATAAAACLAVTALSFLPPPGAEGVHPASVQEYWRDLIARRQKARERAAALARVADDNPEVRSQLGHQLIEAGRIHEGIREHRRAMELDSANAGLCVAFSQDLLTVGYERESIELLREAIRNDPSFGSAAANSLLTHVLRERPDLVRSFPRQLVELGEHACEVTHRSDPVLLSTLAAVYLRVGRAEDARDTADRALALAESAGDRRLAASLRELIDRCREGAGRPEGASLPRQ